MYEKIKAKRQNGVTLIALVITIIILLILAGVTIAMLTSDSSVLQKASEAKEKSAEAEAKEKLTLLITEWQMEYMEKGQPTFAEFLSKTGENWSKVQSYGVQDVSEEGDGQLVIVMQVGTQRYDVPVDVTSAGNPKILANEVQKTGTRIKSQLSQTGYAFEGGEIEVTVTATPPDGETITGITSTSTAKNDLTNNSRTFKVTSNPFQYTITTDSQSKTFSRTVNFLSAPELTTAAIQTTENSITIDTTKLTQYPAEAGIRYKYYYSTTSGSGYTETDNNQIASLNSSTTYYLKLRAYKQSDTTQYAESSEVAIKTRSSGILRDLSGNGNHAELHNVTFNDDRTGLVFNGTSSYAKINMVSTIQLPIKLEMDISTTQTTGSTTYFIEPTNRLHFSRGRGFLYVGQNGMQVETKDSLGLLDGTKRHAEVYFGGGESYWNCSLSVDGAAWTPSSGMYAATTGQEEAHFGSWENSNYFDGTLYYFRLSDGDNNTILEYDIKNNSSVELGR